MTQTPSHYDGTPMTQPTELSDPPDVDRFADSLQPSPATMPVRAREDESFAADGGHTSSSGSTPLQETAKDEAGKVSGAGVQAAKNVAGTAKDEVSNVVAETRQQATSLLESVRGEVAAQSGAQQQRLAASLHSISQELDGLASGSQQSGPVTDLVVQAARKSGEFADWLESHEPADLLNEAQSFARRRPVAFLALCGLAGVLAGRIARGASDRDPGGTGADTSYGVGSSGPGEVR